MTNLKPVEETATPVAAPNMTPGALMFQAGNLEKIEHFAEIMSKSRNMVPQHLRGNASDCMAVIMQAAQWGMDPFAVAQKTYQVKQGAPVAYEAQLINAVVIANGPLIGRPKYEYFGPWEKIQGNVVIKTSQNGNKYAAAGWKPEDEVGVGVNVIVHVKGEPEPTKLEVLLKQCYPRNSTNWANNPKQQIAYAAIRMIARRDFPDVIMGVYANDEIDLFESEKVINPDEGSVESLVAEKAPETMPIEDRITNFKKAIKDAGNKNRLMAIGAQIKAAEPEVQDALRDAFGARLQDFTEPAPDQVDIETGEIQSKEEQQQVDFAQLRKLIEGADSLESLADVAEILKPMDHRRKEVKELTDLINLRQGEIQNNG